MEVSGDYGFWKLGQESQIGCMTTAQGHLWHKGVQAGEVRVWDFVDQDTRLETQALVPGMRFCVQNLFIHSTNLCWVSSLCLVLSWVL